MGNFLHLLVTTDSLSKWDSFSLFVGNLALSAFVIGYLQAALMDLPMEQLEPHEMLIVGVISIISSLLITNRVAVLELTHEHFLKFQREAQFSIDINVKNPFNKRLYSSMPVEGPEEIGQLFAKYFANIDQLQVSFLASFKEEPSLLIEMPCFLKEFFDLWLAFA